MIKIIDHPVIRVKLSKMRNRDTDSREFKQRLIELSQLMCYEVTRDYQTKTFPINTPLAKTDGFKLKDSIVLVAILRAGLGMIQGFNDVLPSAASGFVGLYRDEETLKPVQYYSKMPENIKSSNVIVLDPMLATGHSALAAINIVKKFKPKSIKFVCIVASTTGVKTLSDGAPDIDIYAAAVDNKLNNKGYIVPGLGDAGDRIFKTK